MPDAYSIFDRQRLRQHRDRAAAEFAQHDFLQREIVIRLVDRLGDITRQFPHALVIGPLAGAFTGKSGIEYLVQADVSEAMIKKEAGQRLVMDTEWLPFAPQSFDLVMVTGLLHWINDLPGALIQIQRALKPDGLFLAMLPGGQTLKELRQSFEFAEMESSGGVSPRISPFIDVRDAGNLLQRAGFALPVVDSDILTVSYDHPLKLMHELRGMGEANALSESQKGFTPCSLLMLAVDYYLRTFSDEEGRIPATFELVTLTGWKPHVSQQQPAKRGSGKVNLKTALEN